MTVTSIKAILNKKVILRKEKKSPGHDWLYDNGVWRDPQDQHSWISESNIAAGTFVAQTITPEGYIATNHGFKSKAQAAGWILYGKKKRMFV